MSSYSDLIRQAKAGEVLPVYLLAGSDPFLQDHFVQEVAAQFLPADARKKVVSLDDDRAEDILADLKAYSLFGGRQMIVMLQAQKISGTARDALLDYVKSPNPDKCLMLVMEDYQPKKGLQKQLAGDVPLVDTRPPFPDKLKAWAVYFARQRGHTIQPDALENLVAAVGDSAGHVTSELSKLISNLEPGEAVTSTMVDELVKQDMAFHLWHLQEAMALRDGPKAIGITTNLLNYGASGTQIVAALTTLFTQLLYLQTATTSDGVYTGLNKPVSSKLQRMGRSYRVAEMPAILKNLLTADLLLKSTPSSAASVLVPLVVSIAGTK